MALADTFGSMPRAARWGIFAALGLGVYFLAVEPTIEYVKKLNARAETVSAQLETLQSQLEERESNMATLSKGLQDHGPAVVPGDAATRVDEIYDLLAEITTELGILEGWRFEPRELGFQSPALEREFVTPGSELIRLEFDFSFEASPEDVMETITRFESSPAVQSVSAVQLRLGGAGQRTIAAQVRIQSWAITTRGGRR